LMLCADKSFFRYVFLFFKIYLRSDFAVLSLWVSPMIPMKT
jgi:hypothetical protein